MVSVKDDYLWYKDIVIYAFIVAIGITLVSILIVYFITNYGGDL